MKAVKYFLADNSLCSEKVNCFPCTERIDLTALLLLNTFWVCPGRPSESG